jgi:hypothetical protein
MIHFGACAGREDNKSHRWHQFNYRIDAAAPLKRVVSSRAHNVCGMRIHDELWTLGDDRPGTVWYDQKALTAVRRVGELTDKQQTPVMQRPPEEPDFALAEATKR